MFGFTSLSLLLSPFPGDLSAWALCLSSHIKQAAGKCMRRARDGTENFKPVPCSQPNYDALFIFIMVDV